MIINFGRQLEVFDSMVPDSDLRHDFHPDVRKYILLMIGVANMAVSMTEPLCLLVLN